MVHPGITANRRTWETCNSGSLGEWRETLCEELKTWGNWGSENLDLGLDLRPDHMIEYVTISVLVKIQKQILISIKNTRTHKILEFIKFYELYVSYFEKRISIKHKSS